MQTRHLLESAIDDTAQQELIIFLVSAAVALVIVIVYYVLYGRKDGQETASVFSSNSNSYREGM